MRGGLAALAFVLVGCTFPIGGNVVVLPTSDPVMQAAVAEAQSTLPLFLRSNLRQDGSFLPGSAVRAVIRTSNAGTTQTQVVWIAPMRKTGTTSFEGILADHPTQLPGLNIGNTVQFQLADIRDWSWTMRDGTSYGGFTTRATLERMSPEKAALVMQRLREPAVPAEWR